MITLDDLSVKEMNLILGALGEQPFAEVFQLVAKLEAQVLPQLQPAPQANGQLPEPQPEAKPSKG